MSLVDQLSALVASVVAPMGVELVDIEHAGATVRVLVTEPGGIGLDRIAEVTHAISRALDAADPLPARYTLEVSSPGVERPLRAPRHFQGAIGEAVNLRVVESGTTRRLSGTIVAAGEDSVEVRLTGGDGVTEEVMGSVAHLRYGQIERARTVFEWGPAPKPGRGSKPGKPGHKPAKSRAAERPALASAATAPPGTPGRGGDREGGTDVPTNTAGQP